MNPLDSLMPQIMNVIQQGMQVGMASFHSSYNEQYHQPVMQQFDTLNVNIGFVRSDVDSLTNQFRHLCDRTTSKMRGFVSQDHIGGLSTKRECANTHK
jgi:hypothetical protein